MTIQEELRLWEDLKGSEDFPNFFMYVTGDTRWKIGRIIKEPNLIASEFIQRVLWILKGYAREKLIAEEYPLPSHTRFVDWEAKKWCYNCDEDKDTGIECRYEQTETCENCIFQGKFNTESEALIAALKWIN
jgi:hypothetical protein